MMMSKINLPENHKEYPHVWISSCKTVRIIQCEQGIQLIVQRYRSPKYRSLTYHHTKSAWASILVRWVTAGGPFDELPSDPPLIVPLPLTECVWFSWIMIIHSKFYYFWTYSQYPIALILRITLCQPKNRTKTSFNLNTFYC